MGKKGMNKHKRYLYFLILGPKTVKYAHCHGVSTNERLWILMDVTLIALLEHGLITFGLQPLVAFQMGKPRD